MLTAVAVHNLAPAGESEQPTGEADGTNQLPAAVGSESERSMPDPAVAKPASPDPQYEHHNLVSLVGRLSALPEPRTLPSGDVLVGFRVVVEREVSARGAGPRGARVDAIDCQATRARARRAASTLRVGDLVRVDGALRRRFFRTSAGVASRYEVEATDVKRMRAG